MCRLGRDLLSPGPRKLRAAVVLSGIAVLPSLPKKLSPFHRTNSQTPSVRMQWHPLSASSSALSPRTVARTLSSRASGTPSRRFCGCPTRGSCVWVRSVGCRTNPAVIPSGLAAKVTNRMSFRRLTKPSRPTPKLSSRASGTPSRRFYGCPTRGSCVWVRSVGCRTQPRCHPERSCGESHQQDELSPLNKVITANSKAVVPSERYAIARSCARWRRARDLLFGLFGASKWFQAKYRKISTCEIKGFNSPEMNTCRKWRGGGYLTESPTIQFGAFVCTRTRWRFAPHSVRVGHIHVNGC